MHDFFLFVFSKLVCISYADSQWIDISALQESVLRALYKVRLEQCDFYLCIIILYFLLRQIIVLIAVGLQPAAGKNQGKYS